jgi:tetratricopeptide (TPR) repeat protein
LKKFLLIHIWSLLALSASLLAQPVTYVSSFEEKAFTLTKDVSLENHFTLLLASDPQMTQEKVSHLLQQFHSFTRHLKQEKTKFPSEKKYLHWVVQQVRNQYLHNYELYPSFHQLFANGTYNCLSGTALYGLILQKLDYQIEIHETAFHAYLIIQTPKRSMLLDATDAENGFAYYAYQMQARVALYRENERARYQPAFNRIIDFYELAGLHYYNEGIIQFNAQNYTASLSYLEKAAQLYPRSERIQHLQANALQSQQRFEASQVTRRSNKPKGISDIQTNDSAHK